MKVKLKEIKRQWTRNGMRQVIESPHKAFNKKTNLIDNSGNLIASTQNASYIRAYNETECNGHTFEQGYLQQCDTIRLDDRVRRYIYTNKTKTTDFGCQTFSHANCFALW